MAGDARVAETTRRIPHPYEDGVAEDWINSHERAFRENSQVVFAITLRQSAALVGAIGLTVSPEANEAELGYWVGVPFWNRGIATEAAIAVIDYGFSQLRLCTIVARHLVRNRSSGRVMQKAGMRRDEQNHRTMEKNGREETLNSWLLLREDWEANGA